MISEFPHIGKNIEALRLKHGFTIREMDEYISSVMYKTEGRKCRSNLMYSWRNEVVNPNVWMLWEMSNLFEIPIEEIIGV